MDWVEKGIAIGNYLEAQDRDLLKRESIGSELSLDGTLSGVSPGSLGVKQIAVVRLEDGPGNDLRQFHRAIDTLARLVREAPPVLVQCHAGKSRSVVVVAGYLVKHLKVEAKVAVARIAAKRESTITPGLELLLDKLC